MTYSLSCLEEPFEIELIKHLVKDKQLTPFAQTLLQNQDLNEVPNGDVERIRKYMKIWATNYQKTLIYFDEMNNEKITDMIQML